MTEKKMVQRTLDLNSPPVLTPEMEAELAVLEARADDEIDYSDIPQLTDEQLAQFKPVNPGYRPLKESTTIRLDSDILTWFKQGGKGWQTRVNEALRSHILRAALPHEPPNPAESVGRPEFSVFSSRVPKGFPAAYRLHLQALEEAFADFMHTAQLGCQAGDPNSTPIPHSGVGPAPTDE